LKFGTVVVFDSLSKPIDIGIKGQGLGSVPSGLLKLDIFHRFLANIRNGTTPTAI